MSKPKRNAPHHDKRFKAVRAMLKTRFPDTAEGDLCMAVIIQAIRDIMAIPPPRGCKYETDKWELNRDSAVHFLNGEMEVADICGVNSEWVRDVIKEGGLIP